MIHIKNIFLLLLFAYTVKNCGVQKEDDVLGNFKKKIPLSIQREIILTDQLGPAAIYLMDDVILLSGRDIDNKCFGVINKSDFKEIVRFGTLGKGPMEIGFCGFPNKINGDSILVLDATNFNAYLFSMRHILEGNIYPSKVYHTRDKHGNVRCDNLTMMDINNEMIGVGIFAEGRYALFDDTGFIKDYNVAYPEFKESTSDNPYLQAMAYQSALIKQPNGYLLAGLSGGMMDIIEYRPNKEMHLKRRIEYYKNEKKHTGYSTVYGVDYPRVALTPKAIIGFDGISFQSTATSIYCLFSSQTMGELGFHSTRTFRDLLTFDWNGKPQKHYRIDREVSAFAVSEDDEEVYFLAYNEKGESMILIANLK